MKLICNFKILLLLLITLGAVWAKCSYFMDSILFPKWIIVGTVGFLLYILIVFERLFITTDKKYQNNFFITGFGLIGLVSFIESFYGISKFLFIHEIFLTGNFDNPAGIVSFISAGLPFLVYFLSYPGKYIKYGIIIAILIVVLTILLSFSRSGILSIVLVWGGVYLL